MDYRMEHSQLAGHLIGLETSPFLSSSIAIASNVIKNMLELIFHNALQAVRSRSTSTEFADAESYVTFHINTDGLKL